MRQLFGFGQVSCFDTFEASKGMLSRPVGSRGTGVSGEIGVRNEDLWFKSTKTVFDVMNRSEITQG